VAEAPLIVPQVSVKGFEVLLMTIEPAVPDVIDAQV
jgi:hypothetical protein